MPKAKTPASVLQSLLEEYQLNPFSLSKKINLSATAVRLIIIGKSGISVPTALRLAKFFGQPPAYWLDLQREADLSDAANDKKLQAVLKGITKAQKTSAPAARKGAGKTAKKVTLADKRKTAAKVPGAKASSGAKATGARRTAQRKRASAPVREV